MGDPQQLVAADFFSLKGFDVLLEAVVQTLGATEWEHASHEAHMHVMYPYFLINTGWNAQRFVFPFVVLSLTDFPT